MLYRNQLSDLHCKSDDSFLYQTEHLIEMRLKRALNILWGFAKLLSIVVLAGFWCLWHCWIPDTFIFFVWHDWYFRCLPGHDSRNFKAYIIPFYRWMIKGVKRTHTNHLSDVKTLLLMVLFRISAYIHQRVIDS